MHSFACMVKKTKQKKDWRRKEYAAGQAQYNIHLPQHLQLVLSYQNP